MQRLKDSDAHRLHDAMMHPICGIFHDRYTAVKAERPSALVFPSFHAEYVPEPFLCASGKQPCCVLGLGVHLALVGGTAARRCERGKRGKPVIQACD